MAESKHTKVTMDAVPASKDEPAPAPKDDGKTVRHVEAGSDGAGYDVVADGGEVERLKAENEELRKLLTDNGIDVDKPKQPRAPSFGISEGTRDQLEREGKAVDPFTGRSLTREDLDADKRAENEAAHADKTEK